MYRSGLVYTLVNYTNTNGVWPNSLARRSPWLQASLVKNKTNNDFRTCFGIRPKTKYVVVLVVHHSEPDVLRTEIRIRLYLSISFQNTILFTLLRFQGGFSLNFPGLFKFKVRLRTKTIKKFSLQAGIAQS